MDLTSIVIATAGLFTLISVSVWAGVEFAKTVDVVFKNDR